MHKLHTLKLMIVQCVDAAITEVWLPVHTMQSLSSVTTCCTAAVSVLKQPNHHRQMACISKLYAPENEVVDTLQKPCRPLTPNCLGRNSTLDFMEDIAGDM